MTFEEWFETVAIPQYTSLDVLRRAFDAGFVAGRAKSGYVAIAIESSIEHSGAPGCDCAACVGAALNADKGK